MRESDRKSLEIYETIREYYCKTADLYDSYLNLVGVFFHDLMIYSTNHFLMKENGNEDNIAARLPFISKEYARSPYSIESKPVKDFEKSFKKRIGEIFTSFNKKSSVALSPFLSHDFNAVWDVVKKRKVRFECNAHLFVPEREKQLEYVKQLLREISEMLNIKHGGIFIDNFTGYVNSFLTDKKVNTSADIFICGAGSHIINRINSANYLHNNKKVLRISHGNYDFTVLNEPLTGYGELSYCSAYMKYGKKMPTLAQYTTPLQPPPVFYNFGCEIPAEVVEKTVIKSPEYLYLPTVMNNFRYGPFRDLSFEEYRKWALCLDDVICDMIYKAHPKDPRQHTENVSTARIPDCFNEYDYIILDYVSTASARAFASDLPIIYFDIGFRNITDYAMELLKKRCFYVKIDQKRNIHEQVQAAITEFEAEKRVYSKDYVKMFMSSDRSFGEALCDAIEELSFKGEK